MYHQYYCTIVTIIPLEALSFASRQVSLYGCDEPIRPGNHQGKREGKWKRKILNIKPTPSENAIHQGTSPRLQVEQIVVIIPPLAPTDHYLLLLPVIRHRIQELLELSLSDLLPQLTRLGQHDEPVLHLGRALFLDEPDASQPVGRLRVQDLVEDVLSLLGFLLSVVVGKRRIELASPSCVLCVSCASPFLGGDDGAFYNTEIEF